MYLKKNKDFYSKRIENYFPSDRKLIARKNLSLARVGCGSE